MANSYSTSNQGVYPSEWATKLQERLDKPTNWKEVCEVHYTDSRSFNVPYMSTEPVIQTGTRGTAYGFSDFTVTDDVLTISTYKPVPVFIDRADLAQCKLVNQMEMADRQGSIISEQLESAVLADYGSWTDFGLATIGGGGAATDTITVSASNIDDIIRAVKREIGEANGQSLADRNGVFIIWRYADLELLEQFAQANGFNLADKALKDGVPNGYYFMGVYHYVSNSHTAGHLMAGVKKIEQLGILKSTWGQIVLTQDPNLQSGIGIISRVDYGLNAKAGLTTLLFDVNVA